MKISSNNASHYLLDNGICQEKDLELMTINPKANKSRKNPIMLTGCLADSRHLFIKQDHHHDKPNNRVKKEWLLLNFCKTSDDLSFTSSLILEKIHFDEINSLLVYESPKDFVTLEKYYENHKIFRNKIAKLIGYNLANLHSKTLMSRNCYDFMNKISEGKSSYQFPCFNHFLDRVVPETMVEEIPPSGYMFLALYQRYESLRETVKELIATHHHFCLTHNNLQLNNILIPTYWETMLSQPEGYNENIVKLINWEKSSWGDPAFDLGTVIASYLFLWLNSLIIHPAIKLDQSLQLAKIPLEVIQPSVVTLISSYINGFPKILEEYSDFLQRVVQFTGLALIYKIIDMIQSFQDFDNQCVFILQLAKTLLCRPKESFKSVFGVTESELIELITSDLSY